MSEVEGVNAIIIDVRNNSGGNVSSLRLSSYFHGGRAEPVVALLARPYLEALGRPLTPADIAAAPRVDHAYTTADVFAAMEKSTMAARCSGSTRTTDSSRGPCSC